MIARRRRRSSFGRGVSSRSEGGNFSHPLNSESGQSRRRLYIRRFCCCCCLENVFCVFHLESFCSFNNFPFTRSSSSSSASAAVVGGIFPPTHSSLSPSQLLIFPWSSSHCSVGTIFTHTLRASYSPTHRRQREKRIQMKCVAPVREAANVFTTPLLSCRDFDIIIIPQRRRRLVTKNK